MPENTSKELFYRTNSPILSARLRVFVILHLCLTFTSFIYYAGYPFLQELFEIRSNLILYQSVTTKSDPEILNHFSALPSKDQELIEKNEQYLLERQARSSWKKWGDALRVVLFDVPVFERAWLFFSLALCLLLLFRFEGAWPAVWILPLIVVFYGYDAVQHSIKENEFSKRSLYPSEEYICHHYLEDSLSDSLSIQREQLLNAWRRYLIVEWAREIPAEETDTFLVQEKKGQFLFTVARLLRHDFASERLPFGPHCPTFSPLIFLYLFWNVYFAWQFFGPRKKMGLNLQPTS